MKGKVDWFNDSKGYGFLIDEKGRKIFCHYTQISGDGFKTLNAGQEVEFDIYENEKGLEAKEVKKL